MSVELDMLHTMYSGNEKHIIIICFIGMQKRGSNISVYAAHKSSITTNLVSLVHIS